MKRKMYVVNVYTVTSYLMYPSPDTNCHTAHECECDHCPLLGHVALCLPARRTAWSRMSDLLSLADARENHGEQEGGCRGSKDEGMCPPRDRLDDIAFRHPTSPHNGLLGAFILPIREKGGDRPHPQAAALSRRGPSWEVKHIQAGYRSVGTRPVEEVMQMALIQGHAS